MRVQAYVFAEFELDCALYQLRRGDALLDIGARNFDVLAYLIRHHGRIVSREELIREVWGVAVMSESTVPTAINAVRRALDDDPAAPRFIETHRGRGYRFVADITERIESGATRPAGQPHAEPPHSVFVGREAELHALYAAFEQALARTPRLVLVVGEAGIGKTRLLEQFAPWVRQDGSTVLFGRCHEGEGAPAFWPWTQIVRSYVDDTGARDMPSALAPAASVIAQMMPELTERFPDLAPPRPLVPEQARFRLFDAVATFLRRAAEERPLVLLFDDLHQADESSLSLLQFVVRQTANARILVVATSRDVPPGARTDSVELLAELARESTSQPLRLSPLSQSEIATFLEERAPGRPVQPELVQALLEQSGGNPFFLNQLADLLLAEGNPPTLSEELLASLPPGVRAAITQQLRGLPTATTELLATAAAFGRDVPIAPLARLMNRESAETLALLQPAISGRLLAPLPTDPNRLRFTHMLVRDTLYETLPLADRAQLHLAIARQLEQANAADPEPAAATIAHHYALASPLVGPALAVRHSRAAARWASERLAYEDAAFHLQRALTALELSADHALEDRCEILLDLGSAQIRAARRSAAEDSLKRSANLARKIHRPDLLARAALELAPGLFAFEVGVFDPYLVNLLREALAGVDYTNHELRALLLARLALALIWSNDVSQAANLSQQALEASEKSGSPYVTAFALTAQLETLWAPESFDDRLETIHRIGDIVEVSPTPDLNLTYRVQKIAALLEQGEISQVDAEISAFERLAALVAQPHALWYVKLLHAMRALMLGHFARAEGLAQEFLELGRRAGDHNAYQSFAAQSVLLNWERGTVRSLELAERRASDSPTMQAWKCAVCFFSFEAGDTRRAAKELERISLDEIPMNVTRQISLALLANVASGLSNRPLAQSLYDLLLPYRNRFSVAGYATTFFGSVERELGKLAATLGDLDLAIDHLHLALLQNERLAAHPWIARAQADLAVFLLERSRPADRSSAMRLIQAANETAVRLDLGQIRRRTAELLAHS